MPRLVHETKYTNKEIIKKTKEINSLFHLHDSIRGMIDMVKKDRILRIFYEKAKEKFKDDMIDTTNNPEIYEPEVFLLHETILCMKEYIEEFAKEISNE